MHLYADVDPNEGNNANTGGIDDFTGDNQMQFDFFAVNLLTATGSLAANNDGIAFEGIECFDITIDLGNSCADSYGSIPSTSICVIDRTRMYLMYQCMERIPGN